MSRSAQSRTLLDQVVAPEIPVRIEDLEQIACVYGPGTTLADLERMVPLGWGWARGIEQWRASDSPYLLLRSSTFDGGSHAAPTAIHAPDRRVIEQAILATSLHAGTRRSLLESFEPTLRPFVQAVVEASHRPLPGA